MQITWWILHFLCHDSLIIDETYSVKKQLNHDTKGTAHSNMATSTYHYMPRWQINSHQFSPITRYTPDIGLKYHDVRERLHCISGKWGQQRCNQSYPVNTFSGKNKEQLHYRTC